MRTGLVAVRLHFGLIHGFIYGELEGVVGGLLISHRNSL
jgi:hypothetical protein